MHRLLSITLIIFFNILIADVNLNNAVDSDPIIRNIGYFGPYKGKVNADSLAKAMLDYDYGSDSSLSVNSLTNSLIAAKATGSVGMHYLWQVNKKMVSEDNVFCVSKIISDSDQFVMLVANMYSLVGHVYLNGDKVISSNNPKEIGKPQKVKLKKGVNDIFIHAQCYGEPWFVIQVYPKYSQFEGVIKYENGNIAPFTRIGLYDKKNGTAHGWTTSDEAGKYTSTPLYNLKDNGIYELRVIGREYHTDIIDLGKLKPGTRKINPIIMKRPVISGKVLNIDGKSKQVAILVEAISIDNELHNVSLYTDTEGSFDIRRLRYGDYHMRIHGKNDFKYFLDKNGKKRVFSIKKNSKGYESLEIKTETLAKGTWEQISYVDGIQSTYSYRNLIDKNNQLWIGSYTGLSIYDGQEMKNITHMDGLPKFPITDIVEDRDGFVWVASSQTGTNYGGLTKFHRYSLDMVLDQSNGLEGNAVEGLGIDNNGNLLVGGTGGFQILNGDSLIHYDYTDGLTNGWVTCFYVEGNNIWIGTGDGLVKYNGKRFQIFTQNDGLTHRWVTKIERAPDGKLWIGTNGGGISIYDGVSFEKLSGRDGLPNNQIHDIFFDDTGDVIISTNSGLVRYNGKTFVRLTPRSLGYDYDFGAPTKISKSKDGIFWISDNGGGGVMKYDPNSMINITDADSFPRGPINEIVADRNNNLWLASNTKGLIQIANDKIKKTITIDDGLRTNQINDIDIDIYNNIWLATPSGLVKYDGNNIINYTMKDGLQSEKIVSIYADQSGYIWSVTPLGVIKYDGDTYTLYDEKDGYPADRSDNATIAGNEGVVCVGINGTGISIFEDGSFKTYGEKDGLSDIRVTSLGMDSNGNIWIGSDGSGVYKFDGKEFHNYTTEDGVANPEIFNLYVDDLDKVWIGTYGGGVGLYDGEVWGTIDTRDGLIQNNISGLANYGETYWFAGWKGITKYRPLKSSGFVNVKKVQTSQNEYFGDADEIPQSIKGNRITFTVNAANYNTHKDKQKFRYRISQIDDAWSSSTKNNIIEIVPKNAGDYTFEVQSIDRDMNYSKPAKFNYQVKHPWYWEASTAVPFWGFILLIIGLSGYSTKKYNAQRRYSLKLKEEAQRKDREARKNLEEKNSELLESQKAAEAANEAKSTFLANMSHELRTPLNAIIGYSEMLIEDAEDENEDFIPDLDKINSSGKHLLGLINDILDLSKVESGKMELYIEEFDLHKVLNEIESTIKPLVEKNNNTLVVHYKTDHKSMSADITKIRQILLNLLSNASKFTKDGEISIRVSNSTSLEQAITFEVSDTGIGMSDEQVDKVFKPFTQADEKTTRKFGGTGLGLTITKMFAEMMGGKIDLTSEQNKGTTFSVTIPLNVVDSKVSNESMEQGKDGDAGYTILVIDDDDNAQDMMKKFLEKQDYAILQAKNGEDGLKLAAEHKPDLITLDVMMPEMDGWEVLAALQSNDGTKNIPVIMLTLADEPDIGYSLGATDYLTKPVDWERLSGILKKHEIESGTQSILIVEDDETTRDMLRKSLENNDYKVRTAFNGKEALEKVRKGKPGLILLDLMMPEMDGFEFSERLRENKEWLDIPVVVITAKDLTKEDHARLKGNVETIMQKGSYSKKELMSEVGEKIKKLKMGQ